MTSKEKAIFRQSKRWKEFRVKKLKEVGYACQMCGTERCKGKGLHIHHRKPSDYTLLVLSLFRVLCPSCHKYIVERFAVKKSWGRHADLWHLILDDYMEIK